MDFLSNSLYYLRSNPNTKFFAIVCSLANLSGIDFMTQYVSNFVTLKACNVKTIQWHYFQNLQAPTILEWCGYKVFNITSSILALKKVTQQLTISWTCTPFPVNWRVILFTVTKGSYNVQVFEPATVNQLVITVVSNTQYWLACVTGTTNTYSITLPAVPATTTTSTIPSYTYMATGFPLQPMFSYNLV